MICRKTIITDGTANLSQQAVSFILHFIPLYCNTFTLTLLTLLSLTRTLQLCRLPQKLGKWKHNVTLKHKSATLPAQAGMQMTCCILLAWCQWAVCPFASPTANKSMQTLGCPAIKCRPFLLVCRYVPCRTARHVNGMRLLDRHRLAP